MRGGYLTEFAGLRISIFLSVISSVSLYLCRGADCDRFHCSSEPFLQRVIDPYLRPSATFTTPCSCLSDWNSLFCNHTQAILSSPAHVVLELPTICICRKFSDNGNKCQQFISRCFNRKNHECTCCFNQPNKYCNHLKCKNGEPDFGLSNTTCICHHNPADYPYQICKSFYMREGSSSRGGSIPERQESINKVEKNKEIMLTVLGMTVSSSMVTCIIVVLLAGIVILTSIILIAGNWKLRKRREENIRQRQIAHNALLMERADDDRYLPTV